MKGSSVAGRALALALAATLASGCAGGGFGGPATVPATSGAAMRSAVKSSDLLYVLNHAQGASSVEFVTFPQGKFVGTLQSYGFPASVCSGISGTIWVPFYTGGKMIVAEFAHGGKSPIAKLQAPLKAANGCAVDPNTGNLALLSETGIDGSGKILVWTAGKGKPKAYKTWFEPWTAAYDDQGNLFVDGLVSSSFLLTELSRGAAKLHFVDVKGAAIEAGGVQWDGTYLAVQAFSRGGTILRLRIANFKGAVVERVRLDGVPYMGSFWTNGSTIVATQRDTKRVGIWAYPTGGSPTKRIKGFHDATGVAVSVGT